MILTEDVLKNFCGEIDGKLTYQCFLTKYKFGHALFKDKLSPLGNVITFTSPANIGMLNLNKALIVCGEIYNESLFGGVCFQRLFSAQIGSILTSLIKQDSYIDEGSIFVKDKQVSITLINKLKQAIGFHIIFSLDSDFDQLYSLSTLSAEQLIQLQNGIIESFHYITKSIFIETQRDNI